MCLGAQAEGLQYHPPNAPWPNPDIIRTMPFDYALHDPKYDDISSVYSPGDIPSTEGRHCQKNTYKSQVSSTHLHQYLSVLKCPNLFLSPLSFQGNPMRQEDVYLRRRTSRIKLSKYAAYNTYHHCEQCHQYLGFNPRYQVSRTNL